MDKWNIIGQSVIGTSHVAQGKPCQDALRIENDPSNRYHIAALADGHGSAHCPYSSEGAQAAVDIAVGVLNSLLENLSAPEIFRTLEVHKDIWLPKQMEAQWKKRVTEIHIEKERPKEEPFPYHLYGTTLLTLAAGPGFIFALQIGDGDILTIGGGTPVKWLIPPEYGVGGETYSLCLEQSWQYARAFSQPFNGDGPVLFLLSTDGYANSFSETAGFTQAGEDIYNLWRENGPEFIAAQLEGWLRSSTENGSGDDITMALVFAEAEAV